MIHRTLTRKLRAAAAQFPVVTLTGPRQSGKTTLVRREFRDYAYVSLELPDQRAFALEDPRGFLAQFDGPVVLDEVQRAPDLFSYIQVEWTKGRAGRAHLRRRSSVPPQRRDRVSLVRALRLDR